MSGYFGVAGKEDCVLDLFFGVKIDIFVTNFAGKTFEL